MDPLTGSVARHTRLKLFKLQLMAPLVFFSRTPWHHGQQLIAAVRLDNVINITLAQVY